MSLASIRRLPLAAIALFGVACSSTLAVHPIDYGRLPAEARGPAGCRALLVDSASEIPEDCVAVGDVFIGDTGSSFQCGEERVRSDLSLEACKLGGEMALVREIEDPHTSCWEARAIAFHCDGMDAVVEEIP
jgi:hypothetical protein